MSDAGTSIEKAVAALYIEFYRLRKAKKYQEEYDAMGTLMNMLMKDRDHLRREHGVRE